MTSKANELTVMNEWKGYKCPYCKKYFKTKNHTCRKDPNMKSCATCQHLQFESYNPYPYEPTTGREVDKAYCNYYEEFCFEVPVERNNERVMWITNCPSWKKRSTK